MLTQICQYLRNWFETKKLNGEFEIRDGRIYNNGSEIPALDGQYVRIGGSTFNDGVETYPIVTHKPESFTGSVWLMAVPLAFLELVDDISSWSKANQDAINSPYQSESFGGYSYSKGYSGGTAQGTTWQGQFAARLAPWRKI